MNIIKEDYIVTLESFTGPMDLLLHLIKDTKLDIYEVSIKEIIDKYLDYIHAAQTLNIELSSSFILMAAELLHLKSKRLIGKIEEEEEDSEFSLTSEEDLKEKLIAYQQYKEITKELKELEEKRSQVLTKVPESIKEYVEDQKLINNEFTPLDLLEAYLQMEMRLHYQEPINTKITKKEISVHEQTLRIRKMLSLKKEVFFDELFENYTKEYIIVTFLAILEMSKNAEVNLKQENNFEKIWIEGLV